MGGYGGHNNYSSPGPMGQMYPNNMNPMGRPGPGGYPNSYPQSGPMNSHYNNYNNQSMGHAPNMSNSMQPQQPPQQPVPINNVPPNQQSPGPKGAQAAAQAAMIAAANSAANRSLFARQQLESQGQGHPPGPGSGISSQQPPNSQGQLMPPGKGFGHFGSPGLSMNQYGPPGQPGHENVNRMSPGQGPPSSNYGDMMGGMGSQNVGPASPQSQPPTILGSQGNNQGRNTPHDSNSNDAPTPEPKTPQSGTGRFLALLALCTTYWGDIHILSLIF